MAKRYSEDLTACKKLNPNTSKFTLLVTNCGFRALRWHCFASALYRAHMGFFAHLVAKWSRKRNGIYIHPSVKMGVGVAFEVGQGTSICEGTVIGDGVIIGSNVIILSAEGKAPVIKKNVVIEADCVLYGGITVGENGLILSGTLLKKSLPMDCIAQGNPCILLRKDGKTPNRLISPVWEELAFLRHRVGKLERVSGLTFTEREEPSEQVYEQPKKSAVQGVELNTQAISSYDRDYEDLGDELETEEEEELDLSDFDEDDEDEFDAAALADKIKRDKTSVS